MKSFFWKLLRSSCGLILCIEQCIAQGALLQFSSVASFGWITIIAVDLSLVVFVNVTPKRELFYHFAVWSFALLAMGLPFSTHGYGIAGLWCWLAWEKGQIWRWVIYYIPLFVCMILVSTIFFYLFYLAKLKLVNTSTKSEVQTEPVQQNLANNLLFKLAAYPLIFWICYIFSIINRIYDLVSPNESFALFLLESLTTPLIGFLNALAYFLGEGNPNSSQPPDFRTLTEAENETTPIFEQTSVSDDLDRSQST